MATLSFSEVYQMGLVHLSGQNFPTESYIGPYGGAASVHTTPVISLQFIIGPYTFPYARLPTPISYTRSQYSLDNSFWVCIHIHRMIPQKAYQGNATLISKFDGQA